MKKIDKVYFYSTAIIPWAFVVLIIVFYLNAWLLLGRLPIYANPDPKDMSIYKFYAYIINLLLFMWIISLPIWIIDVIGAGVIKRYNRQKQLFIATVAGDLAVMLIFFTPVFDWFID